MKENKNDFNYQCYHFSKDLTNLINNCGLPVFVVYLLIKETLHEVSDLKDETVLAILQKQEQELEEKEEEVAVPVELIKEEKEE